MSNFKKFISGLLVCSTLFCCTPNFNLTTSFAKIDLPRESNFKISNLFSYYNPETEENDGVIRIPVDPNDGVIKIQTLFVNPASKILVDNTEKEVFGYNINNENFYHLRSLANNFKNTTGRFNIDYNSETKEISISTGYNYTGETNFDLPTVEDIEKDLYKFDCILIINGTSITIPAYNIKGTTFINLKELSNHLGYNITYNSEYNTINLLTQNSICSAIKDVIYNPTFTYDPFTKVELSLEDINKILSHSSLNNYGQYFYDMQNTYNVNVIYAIAVAFLESGRGKYPCASYNYFGMIGKSYNSPEAGIHAFGKLMNNKLYYGKSIEQIAPIYCNSAWAGKIKSMMQEVWSYI